MLTGAPQRTTVSGMTRRNQCVECGNRHDNHDLICDACAPLYRDETEEKPDGGE